MSQGLRPPSRHRARRRARASLYFVSALLLVEFLDEIVDGVYRAAWPLVRADLSLSYAEIGILLSVPGLVGAAFEVGIGVLGDVWNRRALVLGGGAFFALALLLNGVSQSFAALLAAWIIFFPSGGAFVNLSQAALMDAAPERREQNMARWTLVGSAANVAGPLVLAASVALGAGWRGPLLATSALTVAALALLWRFPFPLPARAEAPPAGAARALGSGLRGALDALKRREVWRWLLLLEAGNFTLDTLRDFLALYFVDVVGSSEATAAFAVLLWTVVGLPGDLLLIPLLERVRGLSYLRVSACVCLAALPLFLLARGQTAKLALLALLGFANAGWYSILQARLYSEMSGRSGTVMALANVAGLLSYLTPLALGAFAQRFGLGAMMWLLLIGPAALLFGLLTTNDAEKADPREADAAPTATP